MLWKKISQAPAEKTALVPSVPEIKQFTESIVFFPRTNMCDRRSPDLLARCELWAISPFTVSIHLSVKLPCPLRLQKWKGVFVVHSARIKYLVAQMMVTQYFPVEMLEFLSPAHAALVRAAGETISSKDIIWYQKALARGDVIQC